MIKPQFYGSLKPRELINSAVVWLESGHRVAMLSLVYIEGNAPYPVGSQMLVRDDGKFEGQLTGGCAEIALVQQALTAIKNQQNVTERYGAGSRYFDIQLPCGSGLDIAFDVLSTLQDYQAIASSLDQRRAVEFSDVKTYYPNQRLLLFGQGPILESLIDLAAHSGFDVMRFDGNELYDLREFCDQYTALVSLFHEHDLEIDILLSVLDSELFYIGALGSQNTQAARLKRLAEKGVTHDQLKKIHGPVGLDIGAITPSHIAISILAEIIAVMNNDER